MFVIGLRAPVTTAQTNKRIFMQIFVDGGRVARFFWVQTYQNGKIYITNDHYYAKRL
jgi:hypothetical protein